MGLITISGQPGCRHEEAARQIAQILGFELLTESRLQSLIEEEYGAEQPIPDKAYPDAVLSIVARLATERHLVICATGAELLFKSFPGVLRVQVVAPESRRLGTLMLEHRINRPAARILLRELERRQKELRLKKFGKATAPPHLFDVVCNTECLEIEGVAEVVRDAVNACGLVEQGLLSAAAESHIQFQARLNLSKFGISPPAKVSLKKRIFVHPSEEIFANLLDFYRVAWEYEPRSFPIQWDKNGQVTEAFTPDFYLPEFDLYVELTTMKQSLVTKKNRKVKLLRSLYPEVNIQVFYQKDFENLIFKYGLADRLAAQPAGGGQGQHTR
ncbi:MAG TPA: cytidylate kinase family protein [Bryobacteraceae bacterium]|nr:cytidylate kinase family protein [Bryobacteraceae bacterium]HOL71386.1 cytidylate kinase family protein [Bryobacteraceae bacterium]HOQ45534.1 cytidylate kinase family protein [Bryobacteraceae bacterium]HPU73428.1 cytidylate kinase family protein [Bryobacteraceae bacterium]